MNSATSDFSCAIAFSIACAAMNWTSGCAYSTRVFSIACAAMNAGTSNYLDIQNFSIACAAMNVRGVAGLR